MASSWGRCVVCCPSCHLAPPPTQMLLIQHAHTSHRFASASIGCVMPTQQCAKLCKTRDSTSWGLILASAWNMLMCSCYGCCRQPLIYNLLCISQSLQFYLCPAALLAYCRRTVPFMRVYFWQPLWVECLWLASHLMVASTCCTTWLGPLMPGRGVYPTPPGVYAHLQNLAPPPSKVCFARENDTPEAMPCV